MVLASAFCPRACNGRTPALLRQRLPQRIRVRATTPVFARRDVHNVWRGCTGEGSRARVRRSEGLRLGDHVRRGFARPGTTLLWNGLTERQVPNEG